MNRIKCVLFGITVMCSLFSAKMYAAFNENHGEQVYEYLGLGNSNEAVAYADVIGEGKQPTINYTIYDPAGYVTGISIYAIPYVSDLVDEVEFSELMIYDYRNPTKGNNGILLGSTSDLSSSQITSSARLEEGKQYRIYLTVNIASGKNLPFMKNANGTPNYTKVGGIVAKVGNYTITNAKNDQSTRILVPKRQLLYIPGTDVDGTTPRDGYSKFYRIPAMTVAKDGTIIATSDARKFHAHDIKNDIDILCRTSKDNGRTWSSQHTIAGHIGGSSDNADNVEGYGDASLATLPNGDILCTMVSGDMLSKYYEGIKQDDGSSTKNYYTISKDKGVTWSALSQIPASVINYRRGCIAPGTMCTVKEGALAGKVLALFRYYRDGFILSDFSGNYLLIFDPTTNSWSRFNNEITLTGKASDDEAHLIEIGENRFLMSARTSASGNRAFAELNISKDGSNLTVNKVTSNLNLKTACNGTIANFTDENGNEYMLHSVPTGNDNGKRTGLDIYTAPKMSSKNNINWTNSFSVSDPLDKYDENSQYSSIVVQKDGTIGILYEYYPNTTYHRDHIFSMPEGDYYLATWYMNLRIEDILGGVTSPIDASLKAPEITPKNYVFDINDAKDRPVITIEQDNLQQGVQTWYQIEVKNPSGNVTHRYNGLYNAPITIETIAQPVENNSTYNITAYCALDGYASSKPADEKYVITNKVSRIKVVTVPYAKSADSEISVTDYGSYAEGNIVKAIAGTKVVVNSIGNNPYTFDKFTADFEGKTPISSILSYNEDNIGGYQISFNTPEEFKANGTDEDGNPVLVIYAQYKTEIGGLVSQITTNYTDPKGVKYSRMWSTDPNYAKFPTNIDSNVKFAYPEVKNNIITAEKAFTYPKDYLDFGINATISMLPDALTASDFNAVILCRVKGNGYLKNGENYRYVLYNGMNHPFAAESKIATDAVSNENWYTTASAHTSANTASVASAPVSTTAIPEKITDTFTLFAPGEEVPETADFYLETYVVSNVPETIDDIINGNYLYMSSQPFTHIDVTTAVDNLNSDASVLTIARTEGGARFTASKSTVVNIYSVSGTLIKTFNLNGTSTILLPQGVYIANGQKFIVI